MKKGYAKWGLFLALCFQRYDVFAQAGTYLFDDTPVRGILILALGPEFIQNNQIRTLELFPDYQNRYVGNDKWKSYLNRGATLGIETSLGARSHVQVGISGYTSNSLTMDGQVWQFGLPQFNNFNYHFKLRHQRIMLAGKLLGFYENSCFHPYLSAEVGVAFNRSGDYQEIPRIVTSIPSIPLTSANETTLTYSFGVGLEYGITEQLRFSLGYQLTDLGKVTLGLSPLQTTLSTYRLSNLYANEIRLQFTVVV